MSYQLVIDEAVEDELTEAAGYYENIQKNLGIKLLDDFEETLHYIRKVPLGFEVKFENFRCIHLSRFPYVIVYKVEEASIIVYRFINARKKLQKRYEERK